VISLLVAVMLLVCRAGCQRTDRTRISSEDGLPLVMTALSSAHASGSLEYRGRCDTRFDFPHLRPVDKVAGDAVAALREIFADDPDMRVTRDADGIIRMAEAGVPDDLLAVRIQRIAFKDDEIYPPRDVRFDPRDAMWTVLFQPEVAAFMKGHGIARPFDFEDASGRRAIPSPEPPHLAENLRDVTLSQALDNVLQTFPGLWIYENCPNKNGKRIVDFGILTDSPIWSSRIAQHSP